MKIITTTMITMIMTIMMMQASKMEQALMNQTLQVQNEKRKLESELEDVQVTEEKMRILRRSEGSRDVSLKKKFFGLTNNFSQRQRREQEEETRALESEAVQLR